MRTQGAFYATDAPIRQTLGNLADFFAGQRKIDPAEVRQEIDTALRENQAVFAREERDGDVSYVISRLGVYQPRKADRSHMFKRRLYEPDHPLPVDDISVVVTTTRPALTTVEPVFISDYWQQQAGLSPVPLALPDEVEVVLDEVEPEEVVEAAAPAEDVVVAAPVEEVIVAAPTPSTLNTLIALPNSIQIDLSRTVADLMGQYGPTLVAQFRAAFENDPLRRIVSFGNDVFPEAAVAELWEERSAPRPRLSDGDRRAAAGYADDRRYFLS